jgi:hypothetical protein
MLAKILVVTIVLLIVSPFTAPFATCDLRSSFLVRRDAVLRHDVAVAPRRGSRKQSPSSAAADNPVSTVPPLVRHVSRRRPGLSHRSAPVSTTTWIPTRGLLSHQLSPNFSSSLPDVLRL